MKRILIKTGKVLGLLTAFTIAGLLLTVFWIERSSQQGLHEIKQQMRAAGLPLKPEELQAALPPVADNAAPLYVQLTQLLKAKPLTGTDKILDKPEKSLPVSPELIAQLRAALQHRQDVLDLVHQAAQRPQCVFKRDYTLGADLALPEYAGMRSGLRILSSESLVLLSEGKTLDALHNETLGFHMAQHAASDPILIGKLVGVALNSITLRFLERILYTAGDQPGVAQSVVEAIAHNWKSVSMADGMRGEIIMTETTCNMVRGGNNKKTTIGSEVIGGLSGRAFLQRAFIDANELNLLRNLQTAIQLMSQPYARGKAGLDAMEKDVAAHSYYPTRTLTAILMPVYSQATGKQAQGEAQAATVQAAAAVLAYHQQHGVFPDTLEHAVFPILIDSFSGKPLYYKYEGNSFSIYSVGPTGRFDGGSSARKPDSLETVFHFPMPAYFTLK